MWVKVPPSLPIGETMKEILLLLALCSDVDTFEVTPEQMTYLAGQPAYGLYLHGSIFIRNDLEKVFRESVYIHECKHAEQEKLGGVAKSNKEWHRRECEAEKIQQEYLGSHGKGIIGTCNYGSQ
jgi:hypothetical protein